MTDHMNQEFRVVFHDADFSVTTMRTIKPGTSFHELIEQFAKWYKDRLRLKFQAKQFRVVTRYQGQNLMFRPERDVLSSKTLRDVINNSSNVVSLHIITSTKITTLPKTPRGTPNPNGSFSNASFVNAQITGSPLHNSSSVVGGNDSFTDFQSRTMLSHRDSNNSLAGMSLTRTPNLDAQTPIVEPTTPLSKETEKTFDDRVKDVVEELKPSFPRRDAGALLAQLPELKATAVNVNGTGADDAPVALHGIDLKEERDQIAVLSATVADLQKAAERDDQRVGDLERTLESARGEVDFLRGEIAELERVNQALRVETALAADADTLQARLNTLQTEMDTYREASMSSGVGAATPASQRSSYRAPLAAEQHYYAHHQPAAAAPIDPVPPPRQPAYAVADALSSPAALAGMPDRALYQPAPPDEGRTHYSPEFEPRPRSQPVDDEASAEAPPSSFMSEALLQQVHQTLGASAGRTTSSTPHGQPTRRGAGGSSLDSVRTISTELKTFLHSGGRDPLARDAIRGKLQAAHRY